MLIERRLLNKRSAKGVPEVIEPDGNIEAVKTMVAEAVAAANETVIAMTHRLVNEARQAAAQDARTIATEILNAAKSANGAEIDMNAIQMLVEKSKSEAIMEAARLAATAKVDAINEALNEAKVLAENAKVDAINEAKVLAEAAKVDAINEAKILANDAQAAAIAHSTHALTIAQERISDAIEDIGAGQRQIMAKLNSNAPVADFRKNVFARILPSDAPPEVAIDGSKITALNLEGRECQFTFSAVARGDLSNRRFSSKFLKLATEVLEGRRSHLVVLLGDSGTGKSFTATGPDGIIPTVFGRIVGDVVDAEWTTITLKAKEFGIGGENILSICSANTTAVKSNWLSNWLTEVGQQRTIRPTAMNKTSTRCHTMFQLQLQRPNERVDITICDMAGYEGPSADKTPERTNIHSGLLKFGSILRAISEGQFESYLVRGNSLTEGIRAQLVNLNSHAAELTTIVTLDLSHADRCAKMIGIVSDYLGLATAG